MSPEKILVIQTAFIGDAILTLPMIRKLKDMYASSEIDVIAIPSTKDIFSASQAVTTVHVLDKRGVHKNLMKLYRFASMIRNHGYNRIYSPHRSFRSSLLVYLSFVEETYGFDKNSFRQVYKHVVKYQQNDHEVKRNLALTGADVSGDLWKILPEVSIPEEARNKVNEFFAGLKKNNKFAAIAPGSVWNTKKYPHEYFGEIIKSLTGKNYSILLIGGHNDEGVCRELAALNSGSVVSTAGKFTLLESIELLKRCKLLVCNDSAPTHLGMCADIPVLTLYCSTVAEFGFYPYNRGSSYLSYNDLYCKPCGIHGYNECPIKTFECGYKLTPLQVLKKIEEILNAN